VRPNTKQKNRLVIKFGGSSLSSAARISDAVQSVKREVGKGAQVVVVVSAMGKTPDDLLESVAAVPAQNRSSVHVDGKEQVHESFMQHCRRTV
jgi:aspartokinase